LETVYIQYFLHRHKYLFRDEEQEIRMKIFNKIFASASFCGLLILASAGNIFSQDSEVIIRYDTIKTNQTRTLKIVTTRTLPKFILHLSGGFNSGAMELTSHNGGFSRDDFSQGKNFSARNGYGASLIGKLPLGKKGNVWLDIITGFDRFQSDIFAKNTEEGKVYYNSFNGGIGIEYNFTPTHKVKYYIGANPLLSFISGKSEMINPDNNRVDVEIKNSFRIGYQAFIGLEYAFSDKVGLNAGLRFTHANLLLKKTEEPLESGTETSPVSTVPLNDGATTEPIQFAGWKQFAYFTGSVGLSYFFGVKEKRYKLP
jgi:opacity protein-like surface antigen